MTGNFWKFNVGEEDFYLTYLPQNVSDVKVDGEFNFGDYSQKPLYFVNYNAASVEILQNLGQFVLRYQEACLGECEEELELPAKDCSENLIIFVDGGEDKVWKNESCVYISGDFIKSSDAFMYKLLGI